MIQCDVVWAFPRILMARSIRQGVDQHVLGDAHLYLNHLDQAKLQLPRTPRDLPRLKLAHRRDLFAYAPEDIELIGYDPHPAIKAPVAV